MPKVIDITLPLTESLPLWPGSRPFVLRAEHRMAEGGSCNLSSMAIDLHMGTHIDAPWHILDDAPKLEGMPLEVLVGPAWVADLRGCKPIDAEDLEAAAIPQDVERLLILTDQSAHWAAGERTFREDFAALTGEAAQWVVHRGIRLVGIDALSIEPPRAPGFPAHRGLAAAGVAIVEGLILDGVSPGAYELIALPLSIPGVDASPLRAILRPLERVG